ncbi:MAG: VCBS repeat-containing protein, partial [Bryobacterales bacterium]|nr:VCBS repeat-containing protein [Bryobacterales bacterium]
MRFGPLSIKHEIGFYVASSVAAALLFAGCSAFNSTPQQAQRYEQAAVCEQDGKECRSGLSANEAQCILRYAEGWYGCHCEYDPGGYSRDESEPFHDPYCSDRSKNIPFTPRQSSVVQRAPQTTGIRFLQGSTLRLVSFSNEQTSVVAYIGGIFRQTNGSLTLTRFLKTASSMRYVRSIPNVQDLLASASGLPVPALVPHPTLLADFPGTPAMEFTVARLSASIPYSGILSSDRGITITNGAAEALFLNKTDYPLPSSTPKSVATADFNGDGRRDVVVLDKAGGTPSPSNATTGRLHVFLGNGDGTLRTAVSYQLAEYPAAMVVYDFNRDNRPDVAVLMEGSSSTPTTQVLLVLLANADGTLRAPQSYPIPGLRSWTTPSTLAAGDFDGDNHGDVIVFCKSLGLILFRGNGDGTFLPGATRTGYALPTWGGFLAPGDLNRDAKLDLAILNQDGSLSLLLNGGDGSFPIHRRYAAGTQVSSGVFAPGIFLTDFNDDGAVDVVLGNGHPDALYTNPTFVSVLYGKGDGTLWAAPLEATTRYPGSLASADFNGDGWLDLVVAPNLSGDIGVQVFAGRPGGGFQTPVELPGGGSYDSVAAADLNADGKLDLAAANGSRSLVVWLGNGNGTFQTQQQYTYASSGFFTARLALGDLSGDSRADVALALGNRRSTSGAPSYALTLTSRSPSGFHTAVQVPTGLNTVSLALADVNADNKLDLIAANYGYRPSSETPTSGSVTVSLGRGDGTFLAPVAYTVQQNPGVVLVRDINKDGKPDLLAATAGTDLANVAVLLGRGDGTFQTPLLSPLYAQARALVVADFDADGKWDLVAVHTQGDKAVSVLRGKGDGTFADGVPYEAGYDVIDAAVGDFDANCQPDLAAISRPDTGPGVMAIFANTSPGAAGCVTTTVTTIPAGRSVAVDGVTLTAPATFQWTAGTPHTLAAPSPQIAGTTRYAFQSWSDGGAQTHQIMAPASATTFVANLTSQYALTLATSPSAGGRVSASPPASDGFYDAGTAVQLTAQPNPGYGFSNWTGDLTGSANPQTLIISAPRSATAVFTSGAATYTISGRITAGASGVSGVVVNITGWGTYTAITDSSGNYVFTNVPAGGTYTVTPSPAAYYFAPGATTLTGLSANRTVNFTAMAGSGLRFVPLTPCRLMETRALYNYEGRTGAFGPPGLNAAETRTMVPSQSNVCQVPATAKAYVVNVTVVPLNGGVNFATLWP